MEQESQPDTNKWLWITLIVVVIIGVGYFGSRYYNQEKAQEAETLAINNNWPIKSTVTSPATVNTPAVVNSSPTSNGITQADRDACNQEKSLMLKAGGLYNEQDCLNNLADAQHKADEAKIIVAVSTLRSEFETYQSQHNSYVGWGGDNNVSQNVESLGSEVVFQNITENSYLIYAKLPYSSKFICMDNTGASNTVSQITKDTKICPPNETPTSIRG
jgi:hypothetical protein